MWYQELKLLQVCFILVCLFSGGRDRTVLVWNMSDYTRKSTIGVNEVDQYFLTSSRNRHVTTHTLKSYLVTLQGDEVIGSSIPWLSVACGIMHHVGNGGSVANIDQLLFRPDQITTL